MYVSIFNSYACAQLIENYNKSETKNIKTQNIKEEFYYFNLMVS